MTERSREMKANKKLTSLLQIKCGDTRLRVTRIRGGSQSQTFEIDLQFQIDERSFIGVQTVIVEIDPSRSQIFSSCLEDEIVDLMAENFSCQRVVRPDF